jgi:hypothetical protein
VKTEEIREVSFEELQRTKRESRREDARRLAAGEVTPEQLQNENSLVPLGTKIVMLNLRESLERHYGR